jgi:hypothetical protein
VNRKAAAAARTNFLKRHLLSAEDLRHEMPLVCRTCTVGGLGAFTIVRGADLRPIVCFDGIRTVGRSEADTLASCTAAIESDKVFRERRTTMLWTILVILLVLWLLGMVTSYTMGGLIHLLLVVAVIILIIRLVSGRRVL